MKILVTGGAGYIGSHTCVELLNAGHDIIIYDNLSNSSMKSIERIEQISGKKITFILGDIRDESSLDEALKGCNSVIHFAGLKAVGESVVKPLDYYDNNVYGTLVLLRRMIANKINILVFSSSATVYGDPDYLPLDEKHPLRTTNPYGQTKLVIEEMLRDLYRSNPDWKIMILRYFNPVGAHESGLIGEDPQGIPNNLMPFVAQVAIGRRDQLSVFGGDYPTLDGTGIRDYIHVVDLSIGHLKALEALNTPQCTAINLGTGVGYSVLEVVNTFSDTTGKTIPYTIVPRREGDIAACYADPSLARTLLQWEVKRDLDAMCADAWRFQSNNPKGYQ